VTPATILVIEDDATILRVVKDNLATRGHQVSPRATGDWPDLALNNRPDLVLLDLMLPKMNGYEICRAIRAEKFETPILMLTAKGQEEDIVRGPSWARTITSQAIQHSRAGGGCRRPPQASRWGGEHL
jgi:DNA-binding response OmpR family regulator